MAKAVQQTCRRGLFCAAPLGVVGSVSLEMVGSPDASEARLLVVALGVFLCAAYLIVRRWGRSSAAVTAVAPAPSLAGAVSH